jgi:hypothetical protein
MTELPAPKGNYDHIKNLPPPPTLVNMIGSGIDQAISGGAQQQSVSSKAG